MAKEKKTLEEKLNEAIVKDGPYEVPGNWVWSKLGKLIRVSSGKGITAKEMCDTGDIPVYGGNGFIGYHNNYIFDEAKIIIGRVGANCGNVHLTDIKSWITDNALVVSYNKDIIITKYLYYLLKINDLGKLSSSSAQPVISGAKIYDIPVQLPPLKEQQRIVDRIESLFEKLDKAKELIEEAREGFEKRKAAVLEKAFRGELTEEWRSVRGVNKSENFVQLNEIANFKGGFAFKSSEFVETGIQVIRMGNLYNGNLDLERSPVFVPEDFDVKLKEKYSVKNGDILLTLTGTKYKRDYGFAVLIDETRGLLLNQRILCITAKDNIVTRYLFYFLKSDIFRDMFFSEETGGVNQGNVSGKFVETIKIKMISIEEQKEIVRILDSLLEDESKIEELTKLDDQIELIKKSILAKAFRGELGTNSEEDESALELLKEILEKQ